MNRVLVTGGAGFIGSHVCKELFNAGYVPVVVDNLSTGHKHNVKWGELYVLDLRNFEELINELNDYEFVGVIHLAASAYIEESQKLPLKYFDNNLMSTINILKLIEHLKVKTLVFSSSCAIYGNGNGEAFKENSPQTPINNYGLSKKICEEIILSTVKSSNFHSIILRYFNASGSSIDGDIREEHQPETHVIPKLISSALNKKEFELYGDTYETNDGSPVRDFVHVTDLAKAHVLALDLLLTQPQTLALNLGSGKGISLFELIDSLKKFGLEPKVQISTRRLGDPANLVSDISLAKKVLKWEPTNSSIENILNSVISSNLETYKQ